MALNRWLLKDHTATGESYVGRRASNIYFSGCRFANCDFSGLRASEFVPGGTGAGKPSMFTNCKFDGSAMTLGPTGYARFERCSFLDVELREWFWQGVDLVDCAFSGRLEQANIHGRVPMGTKVNEIRNNDFSQTKLIDVDFLGGVDVRAQKLPGDVLIIDDLPATIATLRGDVMTWDDLATRRQVLVFIDALQFAADTGQRNAIFNPNNPWAREQRRYAGIFFDLLRRHL